MVCPVAVCSLLSALLLRLLLLRADASPPADRPPRPAAYATDPSLTVKYSGALVKMQYSYPPLLRQIQDQVEHELGVTFNHVMMNLYEDGELVLALSGLKGGRQGEAPRQS